MVFPKISTSNFTSHPKLAVTPPSKLESRVLMDKHMRLSLVNLKQTSGP